MSSPCAVTSGQPAPLSASGLVFTGQGTLQRVIVSTATSATMTIYDNTAASGFAVLTAFPLTAGQSTALDLNFQIGCYISISGTATITAAYSR